MASSSNTTTMHHASPSYNCDPTPPNTNTTFVQADPSTFRTIVQKLTGAPDDPSAQKLPLTHSNRPTSLPGPKRPAFKLQERRQTAKNLQINLNNNSNYINSFEHHNLFHFRQQQQQQQRGFLVSPVSTLDFFGYSCASPKSPCEELCKDEEERAIAEKGFYLHPSPLSTPRGTDRPELLPLFPLCSPTEVRVEDDREENNNNDCGFCC